MKATRKMEGDPAGMGNMVLGPGAVEVRQSCQTVEEQKSSG